MKFDEICALVVDFIVKSDGGSATNQKLWLSAEDRSEGRMVRCDHVSGRACDSQAHLQPQR